MRHTTPTILQDRDTPNQIRHSALEVDLPGGIPGTHSGSGCQVVDRRRNYQRGPGNRDQPAWAEVIPGVLFSIGVYRL